MSEHKLVAEEIAQIDQLLADDYLMTNVKEDLEGAYVTFAHTSTGEEYILHVRMADARKYFASKLLEQAKVNQ